MKSSGRYLISLAHFWSQHTIKGITSLSPCVPILWLLLPLCHRHVLLRFFFSFSLFFALFNTATLGRGKTLSKSFNRKIQRIWRLGLIVH